MVELIRTKLFIPQTRANLVPRPRLVEELNSGLDKKLILISAPAGFGKTSLVVDWLKQINTPAAWLSLDEDDNDLLRFLTYLAAAFQQVDDEIGAPLLSALQSGGHPPVDKILTATLNEIAARNDPLVLVLDDYHLLTEAAVLGVMEFLLAHQPPQLHLVLTTREDPALHLAKLRARDQLLEIRARDLRFTLGEIDFFLRDVMGLELSRQDVAALEGRTEGWVVGLQLAGLSMQKQADPTAFIADFSGSNRFILDYLTDEVLQQQPEDTRTFLLQTSILDRLSGPLCDALTERIDSEGQLRHLEAANLFVIPLDEERRWYRYHHLFAELLRSQLTRTQPELIPELHRRASRWYEIDGDIQAAVNHALLAPDINQAARLIEKHALPKLYQGEVARVVSWFDRLPEASLASAPLLCIYQAWALVLMQRGMRSEEVEGALQAASQALEQVKASDALHDLVAGHAASIRAFLLRMPVLKGKQPERLIALSQEAQRLLPAGEKAIRSTAALNMGHGYMALADLEAASLAFTQTLEDGLCGGNNYAAIYGSINQVICALLLGHLREALQLCESNIVRFNLIQAGRYFPPIGALYILKGSILLECNHLEEAEQALSEGLDLVRWIGEPVAPKKGHTALARLRAIQGDQPATMATLKTLEETWPEGALYTQALRHRLTMRHWRDDANVQENAHTWLADARSELDELPLINGVDPLSISYFECYLNMAHVLARLAVRKPGAYPVDGVHANLERLQEFAISNGFVSWVVEIAIARILLYQAMGKKEEALRTLNVALSAAASQGLFRIFVDECDLLQALLIELKPQLTDRSLIAYADRLLGSMSCGSVKTDIVDKHERLLSGREIEVLHGLGKGLSYEEIGQQLYLSLNTVQFHVKNIYRKLLVNKRVQAIEKAREMDLI